MGIIRLRSLLFPSIVTCRNIILSSSFSVRPSAPVALSHLLSVRSVFGLKSSRDMTTVCQTTTTTTSESSTTCSGSPATSEPNNPLLASWSNEPYHLPPFQQIQPHHFPPAFDVAMKEHLQDLESIVRNPEPPTFHNVMIPYDTSGYNLGRIGAVFSNMCSSLNTPELQQVQTDMAPVLSRHDSATFTYPGLFDKIKSVYHTRLDQSAALTPEQIRLVERLYMDFTREGAHFNEHDAIEYANLSAQLASLQTQFAQNVLKDEEVYELVFTRDELAGCPTSLIEAARQAAVERNMLDQDQHVLTLSRSYVEPFLTSSSRRDLRERVWRAWTHRGQLSPDRDTRPIAAEILRLRQRQARLHGCASFAEYQCQDTMAKSPQNVRMLLENVWERAKAAAEREREALEEFCRSIGDDLGEEGIQPWDWRYYAEKVRQAKYDFDESVLRPYLSLDKVTEAVMAVSNKLFGLRYVPKLDVASYHPDVKTYEVRETMADGTDKLVAVFIHDNYVRKYKSSGAWMSEYRSQTKTLPNAVHEMEMIPIVSNNNNFAKGSGPTLLSFDDATTLFHEMGHGHHGMLSDATYSRLASTNVLRDFVELPSQLMEHWLEQPEVLKEYARHYETNEPVPDELIEKLMAAKKFNQGFEAIEYTACALLDMALHQVEDYTNFDISEFETQELERLGMPKGIIMRHRPPHFLHLFSGSSYAAGYFVYLWAEVLDADVFAAFKETGNIFDKVTAFKARKYIYSAGNTVAPDELFRLFRGRDPDIKFMLQKKGLE